MKTRMRRETGLSRRGGRRSRPKTVTGGALSAYKPEEELDWARYAGSRLKDYRLSMADRPRDGVLAGSRGA